MKEDFKTSYIELDVVHYVYHHHLPILDRVILELMVEKDATDKGNDMTVNVIIKLSLQRIKEEVVVLEIDNDEVDVM